MKRKTVKRKMTLLIAALPAAAGLALWAVSRGGLLRTVLQAYAVLFLMVVAGWATAYLLRRLLWRVGRRLAFSYFLIGVVPIPLVALLVVVVTYIGNGFFLGHLYRDALHSVASELRFAARSQLTQIYRGRLRPTRSHIPAKYAFYSDGKKFAGDSRAPHDWQDWWETETIDSAAPSPVSAPFVALADGRPTLMAAAAEEPYGVLALYDGDLEGELSERSGVWVELLRSDEQDAGGVMTFTYQDRDYPLKLPHLDWEKEEYQDFFYSGIDEPGFLDRPSLVWAEVSRPFLDLSSGTSAADSVAATLTGSPNTIRFHLISRSAEVDTFAYLMLLALAFALFDLWILAGLMAVVIIFSLSRAVNRLSQATRQVQAGDFSTRIEVRRSDQIGELHGSFNQMTENLEALVASATQKELLEKELQIARELQQSLLPDTVETDETFCFATHFAPSAAIGGDYYDVLPVANTPDGADGQRFAVVVADVSGHGLSAGLRMAMVKSALQVLCEQESDPREILRRLDVLQRPVGGLQRSSRGFVTATLAVLDRQNGELTITNAGHSPTYLWRRGQVTEIALPSPPLGALGGEFAQQTLELEPDDAVIWLSDGLIEATDAWEEPFGYDGVVRSLAGFLPEGSTGDCATPLRDHLLEALDEHTEGALPEDDRTLVVMVYRPSGAPAALAPQVEAEASAQRPSTV